MTLRIATDDARADVIRELEAAVFPGIDAFLSPEVEQFCHFLVIVDLRPDVRRIVHCVRISGPQFAPGVQPADGTTGIVMVDELIGSGQGLTAEEFQRYYAGRGVDATSLIGVETNFRVGDREADHEGLRSADMAYLALFALVLRLGSDGVCAHINEPARKSFDRVGLDYEPLCGRELHAPASTPGDLDLDYRATFLSSRSVPALERIGLFTPPLVTL